MHHIFARNLFLCSLEGLHPSDAVHGFGCSQQVFCSAKMVFVYTNTLLAGAMKPLNMLPIFEKRRLSSVFPEGRRPLIFAGNEIFIRTGSCGRLQTHRRWRSGIWPAGQKHADSSFPHRPRHR